MIFKRNTLIMEQADAANLRERLDKNCGSNSIEDICSDYIVDTAHELNIQTKQFISAKRIKNISKHISFSKKEMSVLNSELASFQKFIILSTVAENPKQSLVSFIKKRMIMSVISFVGDCSVCLITTTMQLQLLSKIAFISAILSAIWLLMNYRTYQMVRDTENVEVRITDSEKDEDVKFDFSGKR